MKKNAVIFPCDQELVSLSNYIDYGDYFIKGLIVLEKSNVFDAGDINIPIMDMVDVDYDTFDSVIVVDSDFYEHQFIESSIRKGKNIIYLEKEEKEGFDISQLDSISEEQGIAVPIIFVAGTTSYTEKFHVQLVLRKRLSDNGYKVSQIVVCLGFIHIRLL